MSPQDRSPTPKAQFFCSAVEPSAPRAQYDILSDRPSDRGVNEQKDEDHIIELATTISPKATSTAVTDRAAPWGSALGEESATSGYIAIRRFTSGQAQQKH